MIGSADFSVFSAQDPSCKVRDAAAAALRSDQEIARFLDGTLDSGTGKYGTDCRLWVTPVSPLLPDRPTPYCTVSLVRQQRVKVLHREAEVITGVAVALIFDEAREILGDSDNRTCEDFFNRAFAVLLSDQRLESTTKGMYNGRGFADLMKDAETIDLTAWDAKAEDYVTVGRALIFNWLTTVTGVTGLPAGPIPE